MDPLENPYTPDAGALPPTLVGRDDQISRAAEICSRRWPTSRIRDRREELSDFAGDGEGSSGLGRLDQEGVLAVDGLCPGEGILRRTPVTRVTLN